MAPPRSQILVCTNERPPTAAKPCCARRGGLEVYRRFKDRIRERGLRDSVMVTRTGCLKHCSRGIAVATWPENRWFGGVELDDVDAVLDSAVHGTEPPERLPMPDIPWE